ncbi:MAG: hypothetical protein DPW16_19540 [Chloroflexi bacterium]|nr:hypothetical protein [Chloroflexota bacterium]
MLRIKEFGILRPEIIGKDEYVFNVDWEGSQGQTFYWRAGASSKSLLEIGMSRKTGDIHSIELVLADKVILNQDLPSLMSINIPIIAGSPIFDLESFWDSEAGFFDTNESFSVYVGRNSLSIKFGAWDQVDSILKNGRVGFGLKADKVAIINVIELSDEEMDNLKSILRI